MKRYDDIVVGSGISGMTLALLLGLNGHSVLLLEKSPRIGGSMARFYRRQIPFDTGFHFTGGFHANGILEEMLAVLGFLSRKSVPSGVAGTAVIFIMAVYFAYRLIVSNRFIPSGIFMIVSFFFLFAALLGIFLKLMRNPGAGPV